MSRMKFKMARRLCFETKYTSFISHKIIILLNHAEMAERICREVDFSKRRGLYPEIKHMIPFILPIKVLTILLL